MDISLFSAYGRGMRINPFALTEIRQRSGLTKSGLARTVDISPGHMSDIESGRRQPSPELTQRIARALKVPLPAILADPCNGTAA